MTPSQRTQLQRANARERKAKQAADRATKKNLELKTKIEKLQAEVRRLQEELEEARKPKPKPKRRTRKPKVEAPEPEVQEQANGNDSE